MKYSLTLNKHMPSKILSDVTYHVLPQITRITQTVQKLICENLRNLRLKDYMQVITARPHSQQYVKLYHMKTITVIILTAFANVLIAQNNSINISYSVNLKDNYSPENKLYSTRNIISYSQKQKIFSGFVQKIQQSSGLVSYKLPLNGYGIEFDKISDKNPYLLNNEYVYDVAAGVITYKTGKIYSGNKLLVDFTRGEYLSDNMELISNLSSLDFFETWDFNATTGTFTKTVKQMGLSAGDEKKELFGFKTNECFFRQRAFNRTYFSF